MKILIYKRTHKGDPARKGIFGNQDCMGRIRNWDYDAVIGIGGKTPWPGHQDIKYKVNWVGLGPKRISSNGRRADRIIFSHFKLYDERGSNIEEKFPNLFEYMYGNRKRFDMSLNLPDEVFLEVQEILRPIQDCPQSEEFDDIGYKENGKELNHSRKCKSYVSDLEVTIDINEIC